MREWKQLNMNYKVVAHIHADKCIGCQLCYTACWDGAHQCIHLDRTAIAPDTTRTPAMHLAETMRSITSTPIPKLDMNGAGVNSAVTPLERIPRVEEHHCVGCNLCALVCPCGGLHHDGARGQRPAALHMGAAHRGRLDALVGAERSSGQRIAGDIMGTLIQNGTVVTAEGQSRADVLMEGERIVQVAPAIDAAGHTLIDATGLLVMPGGIDVHTHLDMPFGGTVSADDYRTGTIAAAVGGTTSVIDFALAVARSHAARGAGDVACKVEGQSLHRLFAAHGHH